MNVTVDKLQKEYLRKIEDNFNEEYYFVESCHPSSKYSRHIDLINLSLQVFLEKNMCLSPIEETIHKIKLNNLKVPDIITNNIVDDTWEQTDW